MQHTSDGETYPQRAVIYLLPGGDADIPTVVSGLAEDFRFEMLPPDWQQEGLPSEQAAAVLVCGEQLPEVRRALVQLRAIGGPPVLALVQPESLQSTLAYDWTDFALAPWRVEEIAVRLRRLTGSGPRPNAGLTWGALHLDEDRHEVAARGIRLDVTYTEFRLLALLMSLHGRVVTRERAYRDIWSADHHFGGLRTVDVHIRRLRSKLEAHDCGYITTVRNVGYRLREPSSAGRAMVQGEGI